MDGENKQTVARKFRFKACLSATETLVLMQTAYGNEALNRSNVFRWYSRFRDGRELVEDDERDGRQKSSRTEVNIAALGDLVKNDRRIASRMIAESLNIPKTVVLRILGKIKLCARFVPHSLTPEQKEDRVTSCQEIIPIAYAHKFCLTKLLREMRPGVLLMTPKQSDSSEWVDELSSQPKKPKFQRYRIKTVLIFFESQGIAHKEFVPEGKIVNAEFYKAVMDCLLMHIQWVRPTAPWSRDFFSVAPPAHKAASVCQFLTRKCYNPLSTRTHQIYLRQTIFCSPS
jgi:hypothetical protein